MVTTVTKRKPTFAAAAVHCRTQSSRPCTGAGMSHFFFALLATTLVTAHCLPNRSQSHSAPIVSPSAANTSWPPFALGPVGRNRRFLDLHKPIIDKHESNMLYIGEVQLNDFPQCESLFADYRSECQRQYENSLDQAIITRKVKYEEANRQKNRTKPFTFYKDEEWMKEVKCCGMWRARKCLVQAIEHHWDSAFKRLCPADLTHRFRQLPTDRKVREDVLDYCSEYGEGSLICRHSSAASLGALDSLPRLLCLAVTLALLRLAR